MSTLDLKQLCFDITSPFACPLNTKRLGELDSEALDSLIKIADFHRVLTPLCAHLNDNDIINQKLSAENRQIIDSRLKNHFELKICLGKISKLFNDNDLATMAIKGFCTEALYPQSYKRQISDLDFATNNLETFWKCAVLLSLNDFFLEAISLRKDNDTANIFGVANMTVQSLYSSNDFLTIDFVMGAYPLLITSSAPFTDGFWKNVTWINGDDTFQGPSVRYSMLIYLQELHERSELLIRDLHDFHVLSNSLTDNDFTWLNQKIAEFELMPMVKKLNNDRLRLLPREKETNKFLEFIFNHYNFENKRPSIENKIENVSNYYRTGFFKTDLRRKLSPLQIFMSSFKHFARSEKLRSFLLFILRFLNPRWLYEKGAYIQMMHLDLEPTANLQWIEFKTEKILLTPLGAFIPVPFGLAQMDKINNLRKEIRQSEL